MHIATTTLVCAAALVLTAVAPSAPPLPPKPAHGDAPEPADSGKPKPKLTGDPKWLTRLHTRPGHTKQLTKDNFDEWVTDAVNGKKSAIVRWISTDDTSDCSWIIQRHGSSGDQALGGDKPPKEDYCKIMAKSSQQWNEVAEKYKDDSTVVFGDVVLSDWKDLVEDVKKVRTDLMKPMEEHDEEVETMPEQPAHLSTIFANEVTELDYMYAEHIEEHIAEHIEEQPESGEEPENDDKDQMPTYAKHNFGCTIRVYDMSSGTGDEISGQGWSPECRDYVQTREADDFEHPLEEDPPDEEDHLPDIDESDATEPPPLPESEVSESETLHIDESNTTDPPPSPEPMSEHVDKDSEHYVDVSEATDPPPEPESEDSHEEEQEHYHEQPEDYLSHDYHQEVYPEHITLDNLVTHSKERLVQTIKDTFHLQEM